MSSQPWRTGPHRRRAFGSIVTGAIIIGFACVLSPVAFGANPIDEMAKAGATAGTWILRASLGRP
jgi:hypothetical protein